MTSIFLIGAGQHAKCVAAVVRAQGLYDIAGLISSDAKALLDEPILGADEDREKLAKKYGTKRFIIAVGRSIPLRIKLYEDYLAAGWEPVNVIHPTAVIGPDVKMGKGNLIEAGSIITPDVVLGDNLLINPGVILNHDTIIHSHCHIAGGVSGAGRVEVGQGTLIGTGATLGPDVTIGEQSIVGAGAVVVDDLDARGVYVGVPARFMRENRNV